MVDAELGRKRIDTMTMAWELEARVPFVDHEFVELVAACPPELKLAGGGKGVLQRAALGVVPDAVTDPNTQRTTMGSNALWQVALVEMWLQERGI